MPIPPYWQRYDASYDILEDWIFPQIPQNDWINPLMAQIWQQNNINFGSVPVLEDTEIVRRTRAVVRARAEWSNVVDLGYTFEYRRQAKYLKSDFFYWVHRHLPFISYPDLAKSRCLRIVYEFVTSKIFHTAIFTAFRVVNILGFILSIYAVINNVDDVPVELEEYLSALRPLPYVDNAKTTLRVHYLPTVDARTFYNPLGKKRFSFPHVKQDVMDADLHRLGEALKVNGSVYKYPPHIIMYYEIVTEVEFEVDLSVPA